MVTGTVNKDEIAAIIGLDMAVPESYDKNNNNIANITLMKTGSFLAYIDLRYLILLATWDLLLKNTNKTDCLITKTH